MSPFILNILIKISVRTWDNFMSGRIKFHILVLKVSSLGEHILFQQNSKLVPFHFINHSKLYNYKNVLKDIKIKVKQVHSAERNADFLVCFLSFVHCQYFSILKKCTMKKLQHGNSRVVVRTPVNMWDGELCNNI